MAQSIKLGSDTFLDSTGVVVGQMPLTSHGSWTPQVYDNDTDTGMRLVGEYYRCGNLYIAIATASNFTPNRNISTMFQIRGCPFTSILGGNIYISSNFSGAGGQETIQITTNGRVYFRPNITLNAGTNYGSLNVVIYGWTTTE